MNPTGTILQEGERAAIAFERHFAFTPEQVWAAITESADLAVWYGQVTHDGRAGGVITIVAGPTHVPEDMRRSEGRILTWDPPRVFEYELNQKLIGPSVVRYELAPEADGTVLRVRHQWLAKPSALGYAPGWHAYLDRLAAHLAGEPLPDWQTRYGEVRTAYGWSA